MTEGPRWVELTRTVGEINARLIAGDLENEEIRTHIELEASSWFYGAEDPNRLATIYVLEEDIDRAESVLHEASGGEIEDLADETTGTDAEAQQPDAWAEPDYAILAEQDTGLRSRPLRWLIAAVIVGALSLGVFKGEVLDFLNLEP